MRVHKIVGKKSEGPVTVCPAWIHGYGEVGFWGASRWNKVTCKFCLKKRKTAKGK